jgi:hypothetical protein
MFDAYRRYRSLHELMALLDAAMARATTHAAPELQALRQLIDDLCESGAAASTAINITALRHEVLNRVRCHPHLLEPGAAVRN